MKFNCNRSQIWFKVLDLNGLAIDNSNEIWVLPFGTNKGPIMDFSGQPVCYPGRSAMNLRSSSTGTWLVSDPSPLFKGFADRRRVFVAELLSDPTGEIPGIIWLEKVRLVREATTLDLKRFGIHLVFRPE